MDWTQNRLKWNTTFTRQDEKNTKTEIRKKNEKKLKSFLGAIQYLSKYIENLSAQTGILGKLLSKTKQVDMDR